MKLKPKVKLEVYGRECIIKVSDNRGFKDDMAITYEEAEMLYKLLKKYIEKKGKETKKENNKPVKKRAG